MTVTNFTHIIFILLYDLVVLSHFYFYLSLILDLGLGL